MNLEYKLVEYNTHEKKELNVNINRMKKEILKEIVQKLNWEEKQKTMTEDEKKEFLNTICKPDFVKISFPTIN